MQVWLFFLGIFFFFEAEQARPCLLKVKHITQSLGSEAGQIGMSSEMALYEIPIFSYQGPETMHASKEQAWLCLKTVVHFEAACRGLNGNATMAKQLISVLLPISINGNLSS